VRRFAAHRRLLAIPLALAVVVVGGFLLVRDSSVVAVEHVEIAGAKGPEAGRVRSALKAAAREMTTLHVRTDALRDAVRPFPTVKDVRIERDLPDRLRVIVVGRPAVAALSAGDQQLGVAADGTLLRGSPVPDDVPVLRVRALPGGPRLTDPRARRVVALLAAAPEAMRRHVERAGIGDQGLEARLREGPRVIAGQPHRLRAKWVAAARVLGDKGARGAEYVDVRVPERAVAGGLPIDEQPSTQG
jgi:cell division protein FtsQ